jgi:hypothetical protein
MFLRNVDIHLQDFTVLQSIIPESGHSPLGTSCTKMLVEKVKERDHLEDLEEDGRIVLN